MLRPCLLQDKDGVVTAGELQKGFKSIGKRNMPHVSNVWLHRSAGENYHKEEVHIQRMRIVPLMRAYCRFRR